VNVYPNSSALLLAGLIRTGLAAAEIKLFKAIAQPLSVSTVIGDFTEADYDGYAAKVVTTWLAAYLDPAGGASFQSGTQQFQFVPPVGAPVPNTILGFWIETAGGDLAAAGTFAAPVAMAAAGDAIPLNVTLTFAKN